MAQRKRAAAGDSPRGSRTSGGGAKKAKQRTANAYVRHAQNPVTLPAHFESAHCTFYDKTQQEWITGIFQPTKDLGKFKRPVTFAKGVLHTFPFLCSLDDVNELDDDQVHEVGESQIFWTGISAKYSSVMPRDADPPVWLAGTAQPSATLRFPYERDAALLSQLMLENPLESTIKFTPVKSSKSTHSVLKSAAKVALSRAIAVVCVSSATASTELSYVADWLKTSRFVKVAMAHVTVSWKSTTSNPSKQLASSMIQAFVTGGTVKCNSFMFVPPPFVPLSGVSGIPAVAAALLGKGWMCEYTAGHQFQVSVSTLSDMNDSFGPFTNEAWRPLDTFCGETIASTRHSRFFKAPTGSDWVQLLSENPKLWTATSFRGDIYNNADSLAKFVSFTDPAAGLVCEALVPLLTWFGDTAKDRAAEFCRCTAFEYVGKSFYKHDKAFVDLVHNTKFAAFERLVQRYAAWNGADKYELTKRKCVAAAMAVLLVGDRQIEWADPVAMPPLPWCDCDTMPEMLADIPAFHKVYKDRAVQLQDVLAQATTCPNAFAAIEWAMAQDMLTAETEIETAVLAQMRRMLRGACPALVAFGNPLGTARVEKRQRVASVVSINVSGALAALSYATIKKRVVSGHETDIDVFKMKAVNDRETQVVYMSERAHTDSLILLNTPVNFLYSIEFTKSDDMSWNGRVDSTPPRTFVCKKQLAGRYVYRF